MLREEEDLLPGSSAECGNPGLQHAPEEHRRVLASKDEVENAESGEEVNDETRDDGDHVHAELLRGHRQVRQLHQLSSYQAHYAERRVPVDQYNTSAGGR